MHIFRLFFVTSLLVGIIPNSATAASAVKSLHGLLSAGDCELVPGLDGVWRGGSDTFSVRKTENKKYWMIFEESDPQAGSRLALEMCVAHLDGQLFYDATFQLLSPHDEPTLPPAFIVGSIIGFNMLAGFWKPMHIMGRLEIGKNALHINFLDNDWLQDALKSRLVSVSSAKDEDGEDFLTSPTEELKVFAARLVSNPKAFSDQLDLTRVPEKK